jgi:hypothetical protein
MGQTPELLINHGRYRTEGFVIPLHPLLQQFADLTGGF